METPNILIAGYSGAGNIGDELLLSCLLEQVGDIHPGAGICVISFNPSVTEGLHGVSSVSTRSADVLSALTKADVVILGPGGIFHDAVNSGSGRHQSGVSFYGALAAEATRTGRQVFVVGAGAGPLTTPTAKRLVTDIGRNATKVLARDEPTLSHIGTGIATGDLGWLASSQESVPDPRRLAVSVRSWGGPDESNAVASRISAAIDIALDQQAIDRVRFVAMEQGSHARDADYSQLIIDRSNHSAQCSIVVPDSVEDAVAAISSAGSLLAMRFHAVLLGLANQVPTTALAYDRKVESLMASVGRSEGCLSLDADPQALATALLSPGTRLPEAEVDVISDSVRTEVRNVLTGIEPRSRNAAPSRFRFTKNRYVDAAMIRLGR